MSYRYLPWVRRGLAAEISEPDRLGGTIPARASFPVTLRVTGGPAEARLQLYGPGDVVGLDTRCIVRTEPRRGTADFPPNTFAAVEFDPPDLPWMFTPAKAGPTERLRPWLVLVVVEQRAGVRIDVPRDRPLPQLTVEPPAVPGDELPDLAESWAWAHAQLLEGDDGGSVPERLARDPDRNVSRLVCPRRLEEGRSYYACLVPAFDSGRRAGLGEPVPQSTTTAAAWPHGTPPARVTLPLYYSWQFRTGPAGDFESLARLLTPQEMPGEVGSRPMFIGAADPALPSLPATVRDGGIVELEGALRAAKPGPPAELGPRHQRFVAALARLVDAAAEHVDGGAPNSAELPAESVAPPVYGSWHVRTHRLPTGTRPPRWLRDLNADPRHRASAGLGAEVVRANQERYMDAAWEQVGDVIEANAALNTARLMDLVTQRLLDRHLRPLDPVALLSVTTPVHGRTVLPGGVLAGVLDRSVLPSGVADPSFRRMASPQNAVLKRAARFAPGPVPQDGTVRIGVVDQLARGNRPLEVDRPVDGLTGSRLLDRLPAAQGGVIDASALGLPGSVTATRRDQVTTASRDLAATPAGPISVRPDIALTGVLLDRHVDRVAEVLGADAPPLGAVLGELLERQRGNRAALGFLLRSGIGTADIDVLEVDDGVLRARSAAGVTRDVARVTPDAAATLGPAGVRELLGRLPHGLFDPAGAGPMIRAVRVDVGAGEPIEVFEPVPGGRPGTTLDPPVTAPAVVAEFVEAFERFEAAAKVTVVPTAPPPGPLNLGAVGAQLIRAIDPSDTIVARAGLRIRVGSSRLSDVVAPGRWRHEEDLGPVLVGPELPAPLYRDLATYDQDRFLPGAGAIPPDSITLLETNPRFVEAFLVGANVEMNRELLWRGYPTDRRGTPFRSFWDRVDGARDIGPIHRFDPARRLGDNSVGQLAGSIVLVVRGQLLRRYPDSIVYATPARADHRLPNDPSRILVPAFGGRLDPDIVFMGFDLTVEDITPEPGWLFVIQEQPTEPRFGLDEPVGTGGSPATWAALTWGHVGVPPGGQLSLGALAPAPTLRLAGPGSPTASWGADAAHMAAITFQRPFRAAVHSSSILAVQPRP